jgi:type I restriction enzyme M protein
MLTDTTLRSAVEALWDKLWSGGLANPLDAIEQLSFLLFLKRLDEREQDAERAAKLRGKKFTPIFPSPDLRWSHWTQLPADTALKQVKEAVFPFIKTLGGAGGSFAAQMENAEFKINKPSLLIEACKAIDAMQISAQNQDVQGDLYEYLLSKLNTAGQNGQFRTPRHIIRMMVNMRDPRPGERICDPAAGTCGFLVNAWAPRSGGWWSWGGSGGCPLAQGILPPYFMVPTIRLLALGRCVSRTREVGPQGLPLTA